MQRFFLNPQNFTEKTVTVTDITILHQMLRVLRMQKGNQCVFLDNNGWEFLSEIVDLSEKKAIAKILEKRENACEPKIFVTLFQAMPKKLELFELVLQKCTEIGVSAFMPLITERSERREITKRERLEKILREAAEQSQRGKIPVLKNEISFTDALKSLNPENSILLHCRDNYPLLCEKLADFKNAALLNILIGPEGGFSEKEITQVQKKGILIVSLGLRILRTETAAIAAASLTLLTNPGHCHSTKQID